MCLKQHSYFMPLLHNSVPQYHSKKNKIKSLDTPLTKRCNRDGQTVMGVNGVQQEARFSFEAFRFVQSTDAIISTYYVHCATRLCVNTICPKLTQNCTSSPDSRRRRSANDNQGTTVSDMATVSSGPIIIRSDKGYPVASGGAQQTHLNSTVLAVSLIAGIIGAMCVTLVAFIVYQKHNSIISSSKTILHQQE